MKNLLVILTLVITLLSCDDSSFIGSDSSFESSSTSKGGSTARFAIKENTLYIVDDNNLNVFDISNDSMVEKVNEISLGWGVETIFPFEDRLFLGTQSGMMIYDVSSDKQPQFISNYEHIVSCDPVVTDGNFAYLTLRTGSNCGRPVNELHVIDLANIFNPQFFTSISMENPKGLALNGNSLYVCDDGIKIFDVSDVNNIYQTDHIQNIPANDIIYHNNQLLVTADDGFYQFNAPDLSHLSHYTYHP